MAIEVVPYSDDWPREFSTVQRDLAAALTHVDIRSIEHVGSTSVPGLAAKPVLDIDVIVDAPEVGAAVRALIAAGYIHRGDLGVPGREAMDAPDDRPRRHVYVCEAGGLSLRNHLAVRDILRQREDLRDEYAAVKLTLARDPDLDLGRYIAGKSEIVQKILAEADLTDDERRQIQRLNDLSRFLRPMTVADVPRVVDVQEPGAVRALADVFPQDEHPFPRDEVGERWVREIHEPDVDCLVVVVDDDLVVGFAAIRGDEFLHFGIAVDQWGTGLALQAHDAVLERMRASGIERAWLRVFTGNARGRRFYEKLHWQPTGARTRSSFPPNPELLRYERMLDLRVT